MSDSTFCLPTFVRNKISHCLKPKPKVITNSVSEVVKPNKLNTPAVQINLSQDFSCQFYRQIKAVPMIWDQLAPADNLFLQKKYLGVLEDFPPFGMEFGYFIFYKQNLPVGIAMTQIQLFQANQNIKDPTAAEQPLQRMGHLVKEKIASRIAFRTLVCGNLLLTGEHGFYFDEKLVSASHAIPRLTEALEKSLPMLEEQGLLVKAILIKDIYEQHQPVLKPLLGQRLGAYTIQPNMVLTIDSAWQSIGDYMDAMSSKYRVRVKRARKKGAKVEKRIMDAALLAAEKSKMYQMYLSVEAGSDFNSAHLHEEYLPALLDRFPDEFQIVGHYLNKELIGYHTTFVNGPELEAHFLGLNYDYNRDYQLYLNMLYDMVDRAIFLKTEKLIFARTAMEIKSSVGAEPIEMYCYARHRSTLGNRILQPMFTYLQPKMDTWEQRHPFKKND